MNRTLSAGLLALAIAVTPAYSAVKKSKSAAKHPAKKIAAGSSVEDAAWGGSVKKSTAKKVVKKTAKKPGSEQATVKLSPTPTPNPTIAQKPTTPTDPKPDETLKPEDLGNKSAEDLDKIAQNQMKKDPKSALDTYSKLLDSNPNYAYSGDVYANMYNLSQKSRGDLLNQIKYAGMAAQRLEAGQSRHPVDPTQVKQFKGIEEKLINKWIETEISKIQNGQQQ